MRINAKHSVRTPRPRPLRRAAAAALAAVTLFVATAGRSQGQRTWVQHGPGPIIDGQVEGMGGKEVSGAIHAVAAHPADADIVYVGAANGGIWKTTNATAPSPRWTPQLGLDQSLSIGAIAFDPTDANHQTLMAGAGRFSAYHGSGGARAGVWRTADDGATWSRLGGGGDIVGANVTGVAPRGDTLVLAADSADLSVRRGIWRSIDRGDTWRQISNRVGSGLPAGESFDLAGDPSNNARLFTNAGISADDRGIYRSDTTGQTWEKVTDAQSDPAIHEMLAGGASNVKIAVGRSNNVYVAVVKSKVWPDGRTGNELAGLFRSGAGGDRGSWTRLDLPQTTECGFPGVSFGIHPGREGGKYLSLAADLTDPNVVYIGGDRQPIGDEEVEGCVQFPNSIGATNFTGRLFRVDASRPRSSQAAHITHTNTGAGSAPHADSRDMAIDADGNLLETDDGGVYRRTAPRGNAGDWLSVNGDLKVTEVHDVAWDSNAKIVIAGTQDTGTPEQVSEANQRWRTVFAGDGGDVSVYDPATTDTSVRYLSASKLGGFRRRTCDRANVCDVEGLNLTVADGGEGIEGQFTTPIAANRVMANWLVIGGENAVYESTDGGDTVVVIGPGIKANANGFDDDGSYTPAGNTIAYGAADNASALYVASGHQVFVRMEAASRLAPSETAPGGASRRRVTGVVIHPAEARTAFVVDTSNVYHTTDAGVSWFNITGDLPRPATGESLRAVTFSTSNEDGSLIVGGDHGVFVARGPVFNSWTPVAVGLPRAPVFDLDYDPVDEMLVAGLLGRGVWAVNLSESAPPPTPPPTPAPVPVNVVLVLDLSGSMLARACPSCESGESKLQVLKDSVELFTQLWTTFATPDSRLGVNYFRTNVSEFTAGGGALAPVTPDNVDALIADVQSQTTVGSNLTAMGGGLQQAIGRLASAPGPRNIILFTDGMQNVNPMVDSTTFEIANQVARRLNSNVSPTTPPTDLDAGLGVRVSTIGVGATPAFTDLLDDIAAETGGLFKLTTAPDEDLRRFYVEQLVDVLRRSSPQLVGYRHGSTAPDGTAAESFIADASARRLVLKLSWKRGEAFFEKGGPAVPRTMNFSVLKDGVDVTRYGRMIGGPFYRIFTIDFAAAGQQINAAGDWRMVIRGPAESTSYEAAAIVDEERLKYDFTVAGKGRAAGDPLALDVRLTVAGRPVNDAHVSARVLVPTQALGMLLSRSDAPDAQADFQSEPAATAAQRKLALLLGRDSFRAALRPSELPLAFRNNGNGTYSATFTNTFVSGPYTVVFRVEGRRADIGEYARTESRSVTLRFGTPALAASDLRITAADPKGRGAAGGRYELSVRPVDRLGNYLGPDYGHAVAVTVDGVRVDEAPRDVLDGSYTFALTTTRPPTLTNVVVTVMGRPLYGGPLSGIPGGEPSPASRFVLSAHAGAAFPAKGFGPGARPGLLTEFDFEYKATPSFSLEGVLGRYDFGTPGSLTSGSLFFKGYAPTRSWRVYATAGPGVFKPRGGGARFGLGAAAGVERRINSRFELDFGAGYSHVFRPGEDSGLVRLRGGVRITF